MYITPSSLCGRKGVNGGCATIGSARLSFRTIRKGAKKNNRSQKYGMAIIRFFQSLSLNELSTLISNPDTIYPIQLDFLAPKIDRLDLPM